MTVPSPARARLTTYAWIAVALVPWLVMAAVHWTWSPPAIQGDYAQYLSHARAIVEGRPYSDIGYIYHPAAWTIGPQAYPPGLPLALAPIVAVAGIHTVLLRLFTLTCVALFAWFSYRRLSRDIAPYHAAAGAGLAALAIELQPGTLAPMSDVPFCALLWALVLAADHDKAWTWKRVLLVTALGFATLSFRVAGVAIVPALGLYALMTWRRHAGRALLPALAWAGAGILALVVGLVRNPYADGISATGLGLGGRLRMLYANYRLMLFEAELYPFGIDRWDDIYHLVATVVIFVGLAMLMWRIRRSFLATLGGTYAAMLVLAPVADLRYAWPIFPLVGASLALGLERLLTLRRSSDASRRFARVVIPAVCAVIAVGAINTALAKPRTFSIVGTRDASDLYRWLSAAHEQRPMRLMFHNPRVVTLETRAPAMGLTPRTTPGHLVAIDERRITHLVTQADSVSDCLQRLANALPRDYPERFELAYANPTFRVYRVVPSDTPFTGEFERIRWGEKQPYCDRR